jgi:GT2 family glycosyltransferase
MLIAEDGFPRLPLMEDIEFSLRVREAGPVLYLGGGLLPSDRRWRKDNWLIRCFTVSAMIAVYRLRRRHAAEFTKTLYRRYYPE